MKFDDLDAKMRRFETAHDHCVLSGIFMVARIDGRSFTRLTKEIHDFDVPYDTRFRDCMVETVKHLMNCGFSVVYAYTQSDEISLLFRQDESVFGRKLRKFNSVLAGEASAKFTQQLGDLGAFDCRISQIIYERDVVDYFRWRHEDAHRNALSSHCYWLLRSQGESKNSATSKLNGTSVAFRNELLFQHGINFNELPLWQRRGIGLYWEEYEHPATHPITQERVIATRRRIKTDLQLPMKDAYSEFVQNMLTKARSKPANRPAPQDSRS